MRRPTPTEAASSAQDPQTGEWTIPRYWGPGPGETVHWKTTWNSVTTPHGHNGDHRLLGHLHIGGHYGGNPPPDPEDSEACEVRNVAIASVGQDCHFLVQEGQTEPVSFEVQLEDWRSDFTYLLTLTIRYTVNPTQVVKTITEEGSGLSHTLEWDLSEDEGLPAGTFGGYYTWDLTVEKLDENDLIQQHRSQQLTVLEEDVSFETDEDGNIIRNPQGQVHVLYRYRLSEAPKPNSVSVSFYQDLTFKDHVPGLSEQERWDDPVDIWLDLGDEPSVRAIICAQDNHGPEYRTHEPKPMLCRNRGVPRFLRWFSLTYDLVGVRNEPGHLLEWAAYYHPQLGTCVKRWHVCPERSWPVWPGNSSRRDMMNSDQWEHEWTKAPPSPVGGPVPESSYRENWVRENRDQWGIDHEWRLSISGRKEEWTDTPDGMTWCYSDGTPREFDDGRPEGSYRKHRYVIENQLGGDAHTNILYDWMTRDKLRIHEDGNYFQQDAEGYSLKGSDGCIALEPGNMKGFWERMDQVWGALTCWGSELQVPLSVFDRRGPHPGEPYPVFLPASVWGTSGTCTCPLEGE